MDRYTVDHIPGLALWFVLDTETELPVGPLRTEKIVAQMESGDMNFQLRFDTDPEFRAAYLASVDQS